MKPGDILTSGRWSYRRGGNAAGNARLWLTRPDGERAEVKGPFSFVDLDAKEAECFVRIGGVFVVGHNTRDAMSQTWYFTGKLEVELLAS